MEQALFIAKVEHLKYYEPRFSRIYFGNEFCQQLIPSVGDLERVLDFVGQNNLDFTLVSPYVTDRGLEGLEPLLAATAEGKPGSEVVFNDYGVWRVLKGRYRGLSPVMGRLLNRMKRGPRLMTVIDKLPSSTVDYFRSSNLAVPVLRWFLAESGVSRVELDNVLQGMDFNLDGLKASLYWPYAYVTTTRLCLANCGEEPESREKIGIFPCERECRKYTFYLENEAMPVPLIRKGNTIFFENEALPDDMSGLGIDRIVVEPELPI
ncbi:MAG: hypothetical protein ABH839_04160 [Chloroflexota bacterium]